MLALKFNIRIYNVAFIFFTILTIISAILSINKYLIIDIPMLLLGITQIFNGLIQFNRTKVTKTNEVSNNKVLGLILIIFGIFTLSIVLGSNL